MSSLLEQAYGFSMQPFVLLFFCLNHVNTHEKLHSARDTSSLAVTRDLISIIAQCQREHLQTIIIRFLVLARNDSMGAIVVTLQKTFVHINKRSRRLLASKMQNIEKTDECQTCLNRRSAFLCVLLFFCSSVKTRHAPTKTAQCPRYVIPGRDQGPHIHNSTMPARALANYHH